MFTALVILLLSLPAPSAGDRSFCTDVGNRTYNPNSTYSSNLRSLADDLIAGAMAAHSATGTAGTGSEKVYGAVLCRGDSTGANCGRRLREAFDGTINANGTGADAVCALHRDVALYSELYQLRFSDEDFLSSFSNTPGWVDATNLNLVPATEARQFDEIVTKLARSLAETAARQPDRYAVADASWSSEQRERKVYGLAQCTQDMPTKRCRACLDAIVAELRQKIGVGRMGGAIHGARCTLRYETDTQFFTATGQGKGHALLIIGTVYSLSILCTRLLFCALYITRRRKLGKANSMEQPKNIDEILRLWKMEDTGSEFALYDFSQIADATDNFSPGNILGEGGFGPVYKGVFPDGQRVAIKKLAAQSRQGLVEFKNEIQLVAKLQHRHLVRLLGCCVHGEEKILIYEYMTNKSLDYFIFADPIRRTSLNWMIRFKIVEGIAQGLLYLHEHSRLRIIHRDLKASNILLDSELNPKISDFGMARIFPSDATQEKASRLVGTYGYMAPEYAFGGLLSIKSDVFSFGVLILEIISGKRSAGFQHSGDEEFSNLLQYAWQMRKEGRWREFIDQSFGDEYEPADMMKYLTLALMCVQVKPVDRPTMSDIVAMFSSDDITVPEPRQPAYSCTSVDVSVNVNVSSTRNDITFTTIDGR